MFAARFYLGSLDVFPTTYGAGLSCAGAAGAVVGASTFGVSVGAGDAGAGASTLGASVGAGVDGAKTAGVCAVGACGEGAVWDFCN